MGYVDPGLHQVIWKSYNELKQKYESIMIEEAPYRQEQEFWLMKSINATCHSNSLTAYPITDRLEEAMYKLQVLWMRVGYAWELVFTDYGFTKTT